MKLSHKLLATSLGPFLLTCIVMIVLIFAVFSSQFGVILHVIEDSIANIQEKAEANNAKMITHDTDAILSNIGTSLQPGEKEKFIHMAQEQKKANDLASMSFYDLSKKIKMSSNPSIVGQKAPADVWHDITSKRKRVTRENDLTITVYQPMFANIDMIRFHPGWTKGKLFGIVSITFSKKVINAGLEEQKKLLGHSLETGTQAYEKAMTYMYGLVIIVVACIIGSLIIILFTLARITNALNHLVDTAEHISTGDLTHRVNLTRNDEIGTLANNFNIMADNLEKKVLLAETIANGDLTREVDISSTGDTLGNALKKMLDNLRETVSHIKESAQQVGSGALEINTASQSLSDGASSQASSLEEISSSMAEISSRVKDNAENANQANQLTKEARTETERGGDDISEMVSAMAEINTASEQIAKIIKSIDDIAFQTNILALNAAVEAARAGRHGKGFAVVADEVRTLAGRSAKAAAETAELIETALEKVKNGETVANRTSTSFNTITQEIVKVSDLVGEIAAASSEQSDGINQINQGLSQVDQVTQQNTASAEETAASAEQLNAQAGEMNQLLARFKLNENSASAPLPDQAPPVLQQATTPPFQLPG